MCIRDRSRSEPTQINAVYAFQSPPCPFYDRPLILVTDEDCPWPSPCSAAVLPNLPTKLPVPTRHRQSRKRPPRPKLCARPNTSRQSTLSGRNRGRPRARQFRLQRASLLQLPQWLRRRALLHRPSLRRPLHHTHRQRRDRMLRRLQPRLQSASRAAGRWVTVSRPSSAVSWC